MKAQEEKIKEIIKKHFGVTTEYDPPYYTLVSGSWNSEDKLEENELMKMVSDILELYTTELDRRMEEVFKELYSLIVFNGNFNGIETQIIHADAFQKKLEDLKSLLDEKKENENKRKEN